MKPASSFNVAVDTEGVKKLQDELIALKRAKRDIDQPAEDLRLAQVDAREVVSNAESELVCYPFLMPFDSMLIVVETT